MERYGKKLKGIDMILLLLLPLLLLPNFTKVLSGLSSRDTIDKKVL